MERAREIGSRLAVGAALSLVLGALPSAQWAGGGDPRQGRDALQGSFENDVRRGPAEAPRPTEWREAAVNPPVLSLALRLEGSAEIDPSAVVPLVDDLGKVVTLSGGAPGSLARIEVGLAGPAFHLRTPAFASVAVFTGVFGPSGEFEIELPPALDLRGFGVRGAQVPGRVVTVAVDLEEELEEAFASWQRLGRLAPPRSAGTPGAGHDLRRPVRGPGHAGSGSIDPRLRSREVEVGGAIRCPAGPALEIGIETLDEIDRPAGAASAGGARELRRPARHGGRVR